MNKISVADLLLLFGALVSGRTAAQERTELHDLA